MAVHPNRCWPALPHHDLTTTAPRRARSAVWHGLAVPPARWATQGRLVLRGQDRRRRAGSGPCERKSWQASSIATPPRRLGGRSISKMTARRQGSGHRARSNACLPQHGVKCFDHLAFSWRGAPAPPRLPDTHTCASFDAIMPSHGPHTPQIVWQSHSAQSRPRVSP
jgi:hypothetical protein